MKKKIIAIILYVLAAFSLIYFVALAIKIGLSYWFHYVWLIFGLFFLGIALVITFSKKGFSWMPKPVLVMLQIVILTGCFLFVVTEGIIIWTGNKMPEHEADYLIVLGAQVRGTRPSLILQYRIEKAAEYLKAHPDTKVIASGGKGSDEGISEAQAIKENLLEYGIEEQRIYMEDQSISTKENLEFSKQYLDIEKSNVIVVTTDFHVLRAVNIAKKAGYQKVEGLAAKSVLYLIPNNYVREFLALIKDKAVGNY